MAEPNRVSLMRKLFVVAVSAVVIAGCTSVPGADEPPGPAPAAVADTRELIVLTALPTEPMIARAEAKGYEVMAIHPLPELDDMLVVFQIPAGLTIPEAIEDVEADSPGVTAGANHLYSLQSTVFSSFDYASSLIQWPEAGCRAIRTVGLIDAGVSESYSGLAEGRIEQRSFVTGDAAPMTAHGTLMAELLIGPGRLETDILYSANVVDPERGAGDTASVVPILQAVDWMRANGVTVVNVSLAGPRNKLMNRALGRAAKDGMIFVAAAGNLGPEAPPQYPAAFPFVLAVTAVDQERAIYPKAIRGAHIDVAAPGVDVLIRTENKLRVQRGTSVAAPFVTSVLAASPSLDGLKAMEVRAALQSRAQDLGEPGHDPVFGAGLVVAPAGCFASPAS
jgi:subtilisin family serine protease